MQIKVGSILRVRNDDGYHHCHHAVSLNRQLPKQSLCISTNPIKPLSKHHVILWTVKSVSYED